MAAFEDLPRVRRDPLHILFAALRRRAPQVSVARPGAGGTAGLRAEHRGRTVVVGWDEDLRVYRWSSGQNGQSGQLGSDAEKVAELVAAALNAPIRPAASG